ncbi:MULTISPECIES: single-stranded DNA-binding protein [unclassified Aurantimonas]|uniref:single-stranded DNA-binding protein n=1 Tax=unclassified Aurantimonas TaxID=2638230 RepID=UPI002E1725F2|nr:MULTISPECIES: single-stranded DNA-binding protein [unclassified Aurantimonas]MEC5291919.1 single-stranded DNA-binding protein [Aurantimonas sp. C2-3-R2]MEC5413005.1 single-stranded DNA-binding protein [Aurantimonas sp. C2-4-R8]
MRSINRLTVLGNVGSIKSFGKVTKVSIATNRNWTDNSGSRQERTDWVPVTILDPKQAEWIAENVAKGDSVFVEARVGESSYGEGDDRKFTVDIIATTFNLLRSAD